MQTNFLRLSLFLSLLLLVQAGFSQTTRPTLDLATAQKILTGSLAFADSAKINVAIAIYNQHGQLISFAKKDLAPVGVAKLAHWKGLSAATYHVASEETGKWNIREAPDMATIPGGIPIKLADGSCIGGIGVSGASSEDDVRCAKAGLRMAGLQ